MKSPLDFSDRHLGQLPGDLSLMLTEVGVSSLAELVDRTIPAGIRFPEFLGVPTAKTEAEALEQLEGYMGRNRAGKCYLGQGYVPTQMPEVIRRNVLENPGWYTAYTPYQAEIAQGRLEAIFLFQTVVSELTGLPLANASLLDEATAAGEALGLLWTTFGAKKKGTSVCLASKNLYPQTLAVLRTRAEGLGVSIREVDPTKLSFGPDVFACILGNPDGDGVLRDLTATIEAAHAEKVGVAVATDLMACTLFTPPGEMGADVAFGSAQRLGIPMGYGGPHAAFFATREEHKRLLPGRLIGLSKDADGNPAYRMALQTREQHIRREKATSNICTAQVLLAVLSAFYAVHYGPEGLKSLAETVRKNIARLTAALKALGYAVESEAVFDTIIVKTEAPGKLVELADSNDILLGTAHGGVRVTLHEWVTEGELSKLVAVFAEAVGKPAPKLGPAGTAEPQNLQRKTDYLSHSTFHAYRTEHELLRFIKRLEAKDITLCQSMIPLGSCTMKLNATSQMAPLSWPTVAGVHPFAPTDRAKGYEALIDELGAWLCAATGFAGISFQPNSGAQGEYAGLLAIQAYLRSKGEGHRDVVLIPNSAHGTNPASAVMAGMKVVVVACDERGNVDTDDLKAKAEEHSANLAALMVTYPSTHGVFETGIKDICALIHQHGGQVYMDGANLNAQVGHTSPGHIGADVCHLNLHKTFCIPHGGGGPGMGPIGVAKHLVPFLPSHPETTTEGSGTVSAAPYGSASLLVIPWMYIATMGGQGLKEATARAILNANYLRARLQGEYKILYTGESGFCAHEFILDLRPFKPLGIEAEDVAKRLMDYGFHAPTVSFPVVGTLMIEPTESETKAELDRFTEALLSIRSEIEAIANGDLDAEQNPLKNAPHTMGLVSADGWEFPYPRSLAAYPLAWVKERKVWPAVRRIDAAFGDRNLVCACPPMEDYFLA